MCHHAGNNAAWSTSYNNLAGAQASGFDLNGRNSNPLFAELPTEANDWRDALQAESPAIDNGELTYSSQFDRLGIKRLTPDIGAHEWVEEV